MPTTAEDRSAVRADRRRLTLISLPVSAVFLVVGLLVSRWLEHRFGLSHKVAEAATFLVLLLLTLPLNSLLRFHRDATVRRRFLFNAWLNQRLTRLRPLFILYLVFQIVLTSSELRHLRRGLFIDDPMNLTGAMLCSLTPWYANLILPRSIGPVDELVQFELLQAAVRGFATLVVLSVAAVIGNDARPGTLHVTLPLALYASALVAHLSLWAQDRRAARDVDDR